MQVVVSLFLESEFHHFWGMFCFIEKLAYVPITDLILQAFKEFHHFWGMFLLNEKQGYVPITDLSLQAFKGFHHFWGIFLLNEKQAYVPIAADLILEAYQFPQTVKSLLTS